MFVRCVGVAGVSDSTRQDGRVWDLTRLLLFVIDTFRKLVHAPPFRSSFPWEEGNTYLEVNRSSARS